MALWFSWLPDEVRSRTPGVATDQTLGSRARCVSHILGLHFLHGNRRTSGEGSKCWEQSRQGSGTRVGRVARWPLGTAPPPHYPPPQLHSRAPLPRRFPEKTKQHVTGEMACFLALGLWIMDVRVPHP